MNETASCFLHGEFDADLDRCPGCEQDERPVVCPHCDGDGYIERWLEDSEGRDYPVAIPCDRCDGPTSGAA